MKLREERRKIRKFTTTFLIATLLFSALLFVGSPLDSTIPVAEAQDTPPGIVEYRIRAAGPTVSATDSGPDWIGAGASGSQSGTGWSVNTGSVTTHNISGRDTNLPSYVPQDIFTQERWDNANSPEMLWTFDVTPGSYIVRLYMGNGYSGTSDPGQRVFDIQIEGQLVLDGLDLSDKYGHQVGAMEEFIVTSDATLEIEFLHDVENPLVNGIEIIQGDAEGYLGVSPKNYDFGLVETGTTEQVMINLENLGDTDSITVDAINKTGDLAASYAENTLTPGGTDSFMVTYSPDTAGAFSDTITVTHDGSNSPITLSFEAEAYDPGAVPVSFDSSGLGGESLNNPTSLEFGPDDRLYVSQQNGLVYAYTVVRNGPNNYQATSTEAIVEIKDNTQNWNDDGSQNNNNQRQVTGIATAGTAENPVLYVTSSDWRIAVGNDTGLDTNSGIVTRLTCTGGIVNDSCASWERVDLVRGLPRSEENHSTNGLDIDEANNILYVIQGGHANKGAPGNNFSGTPEYYLSAAMLSIDLNQIESMPIYSDPRTGTDYVYDLPTLNDPERTDIDNTSPDFPYPSGHPLYNASIDPGDPFGGNNGLNQAIPEPGGPVQVYSPGYRNAYDSLFTEAGNLYTFDNGPNGGWGGLAVTRDSNGNLKPGSGNPPSYDPSEAFDEAAGDYCTNEFNDGGSSGHGDTLNYISGPGHYGGHQTPIRAFPALAGVPLYEEDNNVWKLKDRNGNLVDLANTVNTYDSLVYHFDELLVGVTGYFNSSFSITDFPDNPVECTYSASINTGSNDPDNINNPGKLDEINSSTNGLAEYLGSNFGGAMQGDLLAAAFNGNIYRYQLNTTGDGLLDHGSIFSGFGSTPLDVTTQGDNEIFPGTIWAATYGSDNVTVFEPVDFSSITCYQPGDPEYDGSADYDSDNYTNDDEIDNGTNHCSAGSKPNDNDGDFVSDLNDNDDDDDSILDVDDSFAIDPDNGTTTDLPIAYPFWNYDPGTGFFGLGFTGLMNNGSTDYLNQFNEEEITAGGATGKFTLEAVTPGDSYENTNNQDGAFQLGVNVDTNTDPFTVSTRVEPPYFAVNGNPTTPTNYQSYGLQLGLGDQDNYLKLVLRGNNGTNGFEVLLEENGSASSSNYNVTDILNASVGIDLQFVVYPDATDPTVQPRYSIDQGGTFIDLGSPLSIPPAWLDANDDKGLAVGVIATSYNSGTPFAATWDFLKVDYLPSEAEAFVQVLPNSGLNSSTYNGGSFTITNNSLDGVTTIDSVTFDLSTGIFPNIAFDPEGTAGDTTAKCFTADSGGSATGLVAPGDPCVDPFSLPIGTGGFQGLTIDFTEFDPGDTFTFSVDVDPISIGGGAPGPGDSGSVSGLELAGSTITIEFSDGSSLTNTLYSDGSNGGAMATVKDGLPNAPTISPVGLTSPATVSDPNQTINITGPANSDMRLLLVEGAFFTNQDSDPQSTDYEVNSAVNVTELDQLTLDGSGTSSVNVTLTDSVAEGGYNYILAVVDTLEDDANGDPVTSLASNVVVLEYDEDYIPDNESPVVDNPGDQTDFEGATPDLFLQFSDPEEDSVEFSATGLPPGLDIEPTNGHIYGTIAAGAAANSPYNVEITATDNISQPTVINFVWTVNPSSVLFRVNAGGAEVADTPIPWSEDQAGPDGNASGTAATGTPSPYLYLGANTPDNTFGTNNTPTNNTDAPTEIFQFERWNDEAGSTNNMQWDFPVGNGDYVVNLYFAEMWSGASDPGVRIFDVIIEDEVELNDLDQAAEAGFQIAFVKTISVTVSDGNLDIDFIQIAQNPAIKGIEILGDASINSPPSIAAIDDVDVIEGDTATVNVSATDAETDPITLSIEILDSGQNTLVEDTDYTFNDNGDGTGQLSLPTVVGDAGEVYTATVTAEDAGGSDTEEFNINVLDALTANTVCINAGGSEYTTVGGQLFLADQYFTTPSSTFAKNSLPIAQTDDDPLYQTERYNANFSYNIPVANGDYIVELHFAEIYHSSKEGNSSNDGIGARIFSVDIENGNVLTDYDILADVIAEYGLAGASEASDTAIIKTFTGLTVADDSLDINLYLGDNGVDNAKISAICAIPDQGDNTAPVINAIDDVDISANAGDDVDEFTITATDADEDSLALSIEVEDTADNSIVSGYNFNDNGDGTATFSWLAPPGGRYLATVTADDGLAQTTETFNIIVREVIILSPQDGETVYINDAAGGDVTVEWTSNGGDTDPQVFDHVHVQLDDNPYLGSQPLSGTYTFEDVLPGQHTLRIAMAEYPTHNEYPTVNTEVSFTVEIATGEPQALIEINPGGGLGASTFSGSSFQITNQSSDGIQITEVEFDLSTGIFPDMVFDPTGSGGDATSNCLTANSGASATGFVAPSDPCVDPYGAPRNGGFDVMTVNFSDFGPSEQFFFTTDVDPNNIQGVSGAGNAGAVSGFELVGATVTVTFSNGQTLTSSLYEDGSLGGSQAVVASDAPATPSIDVLDVTLETIDGPDIDPALTGAVVGDPNQTIVVSGPEGANVSLMLVDSRLFIASGDPPFDVTANELPYYANEAMAKALYTGVIGAGGTVNIPVTLMLTDGGSTPDGGQNRVVAVLSDGPYAVDQQVSMTSNSFVLVYDPNLPQGDPEAFVQVNPGGNLGATTYGSGSFSIANNSTGNLQITQVEFDLSTGILPDMVFDPLGTGGDVGGQCLEVGNEGNTGLTTPYGGTDGDPGNPACVVPYSTPRNGGFDVLTLDFDDFDPGETLVFGSDIDPNNIQGVSGTGAAGAVSGFEITGATVTVTFSDGTTLTSNLYEEGTLGGSQAVVADNATAAPSIAVQGVATPPADPNADPVLNAATVADLNQTITVTGTPGDYVSLLQMDTRLYIASGDPPFDVSADELPFYANEAMAKALYTGQIGTGGTVDIPVTLLETAGDNNTPDGGLNYFIAVTSATPYAVDQQVSETSNVVVLEYDPNATTADLVGTLTLQGRSDYSGDLVVEVYETGTATNVGSFTPTADSNGEFTITGLQPGSYDIWLKHAKYLAVLETVTLAGGSNSADFGELRTGDANNDNKVTSLDFSILVTTFNLQQGDTGYDDRADFNGDGTVTSLDFSLLVTNFNTAGATQPGSN
jgi:hypothetical protein